MTVFEMSKHYGIPVSYIRFCCPWIDVLCSLDKLMLKHKIPFIPDNPYWYALGLCEWIAFHLVVGWKVVEFNLLSRKGEFKL